MTGFFSPLYFKDAVPVFWPPLFLKEVSGYLRLCPPVHRDNNVLLSLTTFKILSLFHFQKFDYNVSRYAVAVVFKILLGGILSFLNL